MSVRYGKNGSVTNGETGVGERGGNTLGEAVAKAEERFERQGRASTSHERRAVRRPAVQFGVRHVNLW